jgi:hypothetical protein
VVEARSAKPLPQAVRERLLVAEDDALDDPSALAAKTGRDRAGEPSPEPVGESAEAAASADESPAIGAQHDVDPVAPKERPLIEAVLRPARRANGRNRLDDAALRRRAA